VEILFHNIFCRQPFRPSQRSRLTLDERVEFVPSDVSSVQVNVESEQQREHDSVDCVETAHRLSQHFVRHALVQAVDAIPHNLRLLRPATRFVMPNSHRPPDTTKQSCPCLSGVAVLITGHRTSVPSIVRKPPALEAATTTLASANCMLAVTDLQFPTAILL